MKIFRFVPCLYNQFSDLQANQTQYIRLDRCWAGALLLVLTISLTACGGGGGKDDPETSTDCVLGTSPVGNCKI